MRYTKFSEQNHRAKAESNIRFADEIAGFSADRKDWQITVTFCAAVHLLQAYFSAKTSEYPQNHSERDDLILRTAPLKPIWPLYRELKDSSVSSRYLCLPVNKFDVDEARKCYAGIRDHVEQLLNPSQDS